MKLYMIQIYALVLHTTLLYQFELHNCRYAIMWASATFDVICSFFSIFHTAVWVSYPLLVVINIQFYKTSLIIWKSLFICWDSPGKTWLHAQFIVWIPKSFNHIENWIALSNVISFNKIVLAALLQVHFVQNQLDFLLIADNASQNSESLLDFFNLLRLQDKVKVKID